jgi:glycogen debranching enzyme
MQDRTRDTLIALPGLTLATRRFADARSILRSLARHFNQGLLPDRLPTSDSPLTEEDYSSVDTTLWFFYALDHYLRMTQDYQLLDDLYSRLVECISEYMQGTLNNIRVNPGDGLLQAHEPGKALTWMNAIVDNEPVTPRHGKPVEVNALWYNALCLMDEWTQRLYQMGRLTYTTGVYAEEAAHCKLNFNRRFWFAPVRLANNTSVGDQKVSALQGRRHAFGGYLYDVIDGPDGDDMSFRPGQLLALSLRYAVLGEEHQRSVMELVTEQLVTPYGLRTLAPQEKGYQGQVKKNAQERLQTLHQGSVWPWLMGPYVDALLRLEQSGAGSTTSSQRHTWHRGLRTLESFRKLATNGMLGMIGDVYDGDAITVEDLRASLCGERQAASAMSTGELLRVYKLLAQTGMRHLDPVFSV